MNAPPPVSNAAVSGGVSAFPSVAFNEGFSFSSAFFGVDAVEMRGFDELFMAEIFGSPPVFADGSAFAVSSFFSCFSVTVFFAGGADLDRKILTKISPMRDIASRAAFNIPNLKIAPS